jgi:hypothetical protein
VADRDRSSESDALAVTAAGVRTQPVGGDYEDRKGKRRAIGQFTHRLLAKLQRTWDEANQKDREKS